MPCSDGCRAFVRNALCLAHRTELVSGSAVDRAGQALRCGSQKWYRSQCQLAANRCVARLVRLWARAILLLARG